MPTNVIKGSLKYCLENKLFFLFVVGIFFVMEYISDVENFIVLDWILSILIIGYGLQIIQDIINGGTRLPKIMPKKVVILGLKGTIVMFIYLVIQSLLLWFVDVCLQFPDFDLEEFFLHFSETLMLMYNHDVVSFMLFIVSGFAISYVSMFFMELTLGGLADGGQLKNALHLRRIKHAIDTIGWKRYTIGYTKIVISIFIFSSLGEFFDPYPGLDIVMGVICGFMSFVIEFRGMGIVYKVYTDNKEKISD